MAARSMVLAFGCGPDLPDRAAGCTTAADALRLIGEGSTWFGPRPVLEEDPRFRQIIPYVVLTDGDTVLRYRRGAAGSEERLHGRWSVGVGGHIELGDAVHDDGVLLLEATIARCAAREVEEEVGVAEGDVVARTFLGLVASSTSAVESVHLGWVELWQVASLEEVVSRETCITDCAPVGLAQVRADADGLEGWSQVAADLLAARAAPATAASGSGS